MFDLVHAFDALMAYPNLEEYLLYLDDAALPFFVSVENAPAEYQESINRINDIIGETLVNADGSYNTQLMQDFTVLSLGKYEASVGISPFGDGATCLWVKCNHIHQVNFIY